MGASRDKVRMASAPDGAGSPPFSDSPLNELDIYIPPPISLLPPPYDFTNCKTRLDHSGPYFLPDVVAAIRQTHGNFLEISALLCRRRTSVRDFIYATLEAKDALDEERESTMDKVEQALQEIALVDRDPATLRFLASTLGKDRGYTPKIEHAGTDGKPLVFEVNLADGKQDEIQEQITDAKRAEHTLNNLMLEGVVIESKDV